MAQIKVQDESGDRKYFAQLPNIILNHSTANDQALYWQMKRYAGEDGKCFATQETLRKKLGIGKQAFNKSLNYLLKKNWIKFAGLTNGKTRPIKTYSIIDIWKENIMEYEKISPRMEVSFNEEISPKTDGDKSQNGNKISPRMAIEEDLVLRITTKKRENLFSPPSLDDVTSYCDERKNHVNPSAFIDFYESKGWMVGKNKMKSWQAAVRTWENRDNGGRPDEELKIPSYAKHKFNSV